MSKLLINIGTNVGAYTATNPQGEVITDVGSENRQTLDFFEPGSNVAIPISVEPAHGEINIPFGWRVRSNTAANLWVSVDTTPYGINN